MGGMKSYHRQEVGMRLIDASEGRLREQGVRFVQVEMLAPPHTTRATTGRAASTGRRGT